MKRTVFHCIIELDKCLKFKKISIIERTLSLLYSDDNKRHVSLNEYEINIVINRIYKDKEIPSINPVITPFIQSHSKKYCFINKPDCLNCPIAKFCNYGRLEIKDDSNKKVPFLDLFCGAGGLSLGLERAGFQPILAIDNNESAINTYVTNRPGINNNIVYNIGIEDFINNNRIPKVPLVVGGPPCQGFSNANKQRLSDDPRNYQYKNFIKIVNLANPEYFLMENVYGMLKARENIENDFLEIGFSIYPIILDTVNFGFPQKRKRIFWIGINSNNKNNLKTVIKVLNNIIEKFKLNKKQYFLIDAIKDLPKLSAKTKKNASHEENSSWGFTIGKSKLFKSNYLQLINGKILEPFLYNHKSKYNNQRDIEIYSLLKQGEKSDAESIKHIMPYTNRKHIFKDKFFKLEYNKPCKTITAHMYYDCHMYIHPTQARGLTPREAARIQGFPDDYIFCGTSNEWYRQIGNSVSPLLSEILGNALLHLINS
jgi:DNA (cytosine-5)-methyltransferase 1